VHPHVVFEKRDDQSKVSAQRNVELFE
jgi:hypothetical protein